ncbi:MAG: 16S rRNA (cytosine(1402)-N(4))-methyltransferase RsmH [Patescibacteria group bacterium]|mgnify:FL=1
MHEPVLLQSVIAGLDLTPSLTVLDATTGGGGHSEAIAQAIPEGHLIAIDRDAKAVARVRERLAAVSGKHSFEVANFRDLEAVLDRLGVTAIDRALFDLGFSSDQLVGSGRGFSFQTDEPLLMTYEAEGTGRTAADLLAQLPERELVEMFQTYGEEEFSQVVAKAIVARRRASPIVTTGALVEVIRSAVPAWYKSPKRRRHFATKIFQALRIATNDEYGAIVAGLAAAWGRLAPEGRLAVIAFHSGEARLVKNFFRDLAANDEGEILTRHAIKPTFTEVKNNPRARSATLRIIKKL